MTHRYRVLLFARYAELLGATEVSVALPHPTSTDDLIAALRTLPGGSALPDTPLLARNGALARSGDVCTSDDELALLPPMAGG